MVIDDVDVDPNDIDDVDIGSEDGMVLVVEEGGGAESIYGSTTSVQVSLSVPTLTKRTRRQGRL